MKGGLSIVLAVSVWRSCIDLEVTLYLLTLGQGSKMKVMDQGRDLLVEHTLCVV